MNTLRLEGCRADTLLGYLKALALIKVLGMQRDRAVRGAWNGETLELDTDFDRVELERFFLQDYAPLPVLNPWNNGAGFDGKQDKAATIIQYIRGTRHVRWTGYRTTIDLIDTQIIKAGLRDKLSKDDVVKILRANYPDEALPWLDAAIVIGADGAAFPYLLGSGGNDGRLDFSINFAARALDVIGDVPLPEREQLLRDALDDTSKAKLLADVAIGQFGPRFAGGVNGTSGFDAASLVNPWDLVFAIEGAVAFGGGLTKRLPSASARVTFPFAFGSVAGGYTSASVEEAARGEMWLPIWKGAATFPGVSSMIRSGRADLPSTGEQPQVRTALNAVQAVQAALTLGAGLGIDRFERIAFVQRNGLAYTGAHCGTVFTDNDPAIALLSRGAAAWVERVRARSDKLGKAVRDGLHRFDAALFTYARIRTVKDQRRKERARACADVLIGLADIDFAIARRGHEDLRPLDYLDTGVLRLVDDDSVEHRIALAIASLSFSRREREREIRLSLEHVRYNEKGYLEYRPDAKISYSTSIKAMLGDICERRVTAVSSGGIAWLRGTAALGARDVPWLANGERSFETQRRLTDLIRAYALVRSPAFAESVTEDETDLNNESVPAAFALLKLVLDHPKACDRRIVALLRARDPARALALALERARGISELPAAPRSLGAAYISDPQWYAAAALVPIRLTPEDYAPILDAALSRRFNLSHLPARQAVKSYLNSIRTEKELVT